MIVVVENLLALLFPFLLPFGKIDADEDLGSLPELNGVDDLLDKADWERNGAQNLGPGQFANDLKCQCLNRIGVVDGRLGQARGHFMAQGPEEPLGLEAQWSRVEVHEVETDEEELVACTVEEEGSLLQKKDSFSGR